MLADRNDRFGEPFASSACSKYEHLISKSFLKVHQKIWRDIKPSNLQNKFRTDKLATVPTSQMGLSTQFDAGHMIILRVRILHKSLKYVTEPLLFEKSVCQYMPYACKLR